MVTRETSATLLLRVREQWSAAAQGNKTYHTMLNWFCNVEHLLIFTVGKQTRGKNSSGVAGALTFSRSCSRSGSGEHGSLLFILVHFVT